MNVLNLSFQRPPTGSWQSILQMSWAPLEGLVMHMVKSKQLGESWRFEVRAKRRLRGVSTWLAYHILAWTQWWGCLTKTPDIHLCLVGTIVVTLWTWIYPSFVEKFYTQKIVSLAKLTKNQDGRAGPKECDCARCCAMAKNRDKNYKLHFIAIKYFQPRQHLANHTKEDISMWFLHWNKFL